MNIFNGGLNNRTESHLIEPNEGVEYTNIANEFGSLRPVAGLGLSSIFTGLFANYFEARNQWYVTASTTPISAVEYNGALYLSSETIAGEPTVYPTYINSSGVQNRLGIPTPSVAPVVNKTSGQWIGAAGASTNLWQDVCYGEGIFVAVASSGVNNRVMTSTDGILWTSRLTPANNSWKSVIWNGTLFVAVATTGATNQVMTSPDGITWTIRVTPGTNIPWVSVAWNGSVFLAVASGSGTTRAMTSPDGITWTQRSGPNNCSCLTNIGAMFVLGLNASSYTNISVSTTGITWTSISTPSAFPVYDLCWSGKLIIAVGYNSIGSYGISSRDGITWKAVVMPSGSWSKIAFNRGVFAAYASVGAAAIATTIDGSSWTTRAGTIPDNSVTSITSNGLLFVAVLGTGASTNVWRSSDDDGKLTGTYSYVYTYYNINNGWESGPSPISSEDTLLLDTVSITLPIIYDPQITHKRVYRVGGALTKFSLVSTVSAASTTYIDNAADSAIPGDALTTTGDAAAPANIKYLTEYNGMLFGATTSKLRYSSIGEFHIFPPAYSITIPRTITGISTLGNMLIVFTKVKTYAIFGDSPTTLSKITLFPTQGCVNDATIGNLKQSLIWVSLNGICVASESSLEVITTSKVTGINYSAVINAVVFDDTYYLQLGSTNGWKILAFDTRFNNIFKLLALGTVYLHSDNNLLLGRTTATVSALNTQLFTGELTSLTYLSPVITNNAHTVRKTYDRVYVRSFGNIVLTIYIDGVLVSTTTMPTALDTHDIAIPQAYKNGYDIQFKVTGTGTVYDINFEPDAASN